MDEKTRDRIIARLRKGNETYAEIATRYGVVKSTVYHIARVAGLRRQADMSDDGSSSGSSGSTNAEIVRKANGQLTGALRAEVIEECLTESVATTAEIAERRGVTLTSVHKWLLQHYRATPSEVRLPNFKRKGGTIVEEIKAHARAARSWKEGGGEPAQPEPERRPPVQRETVEARALLPQPGERYVPSTELDMLRETLREALEERSALRKMIDILNNEIATLKGQRR